MKNEYIKRTVSTLIASSVVAGLGIAAFADDTPQPVSDDVIVINDVNFPDPFFCDYVSTEFDDGDGRLMPAEREAVTEMFLYEYNEEIEDLTGIQYFSNLETLSAAGMENLSSIDLSYNQELEYIDLCRSVNLEEVILGSQPDLRVLFLEDTAITSLDISGCKNLIDVYYYGSFENSGSFQGYFSGTGDNYVGLFFNNDTDLELLPLYDMTIFEDLDLIDLLLSYDTDEDERLDDSEIEVITELDLSGSGISDLTGIKYLSGLESLCCRKLVITSLDVSGLADLEYLDCSKNDYLTSLVLGDNLSLRYIYCSESNLSSIDLSDCPNIEELYCNRCSLNSITSSTTTNLKILSGYYNSLDDLDLSVFPDLEELNIVYNTEITELDLDDLTELKSLLCCGCSGISELDISNNTNLTELDCSETNLSELDISNNPNLNYLSCYSTGISSIDLSGFPEFAEAYGNGPVLTMGDRNEYTLTVGAADGSRKDYFLSISPDVTVIIHTGWVQTAGGWKYYNDDGSRVVNDWQKIGKNWYFFNADGYMQTGWQKISNKWYYFSSSGAMQTGWQKISNKWYYFKSGGDMVTGWQKISNKWYYFNGSGAMLTGWQKISNKWYYFDGSGVMLTGWQKISNKWYYFNDSGAMLTGWQKISNKWYYFKDDGSMNTSNLTYKGKVYYFNSDGSCKNP